MSRVAGAVPQLRCPWLRHVSPEGPRPAIHGLRGSDTSARVSVQWRSDKVYEAPHATQLGLGLATLDPSVEWMLGPVYLSALDAD